MSDAEDLCTNCGAPHTAGYAACKYCKTPFVKNTQTGAIPCPRCQTLNEMGAQHCVQCQAWVVVQCVFCHALSPHNVPACTKCNEAFAGAPQRFAERQSQQRVQQGLNIAGSVGNVAASFLGAAAAASVLGGHSHHGYGGDYEHHQHYGHQGGYGPPQDDWNRNETGAGIAQSNESGGGFFGSLFGGGDSSSDSQGTGAGIAQSSDSGGGFFGSLFGGGDSSSDEGTGAGISSDSGDSGGGSYDDDDS